MHNGDLVSFLGIANVEEDPNASSKRLAKVFTLQLHEHFDDDDEDDDDVASEDDGFSDGAHVGTGANFGNVVKDGG